MSGDYSDTFVVEPKDRTIRITGLPQDVKGRELRRILKGFDGLENVRMDYDEREPVCFAQFSSILHAENAIQRIENFALYRINYSYHTPQHSCFFRRPPSLRFDVLVSPQLSASPMFAARFKSSQMDSNPGIRGFFTGEAPQKGTFYVDGIETLQSYFLIYNTMGEAHEIYSYLSDPCTGDVVLCRHSPLNHGNQWFLAIEDAETLLTFFSREYDRWRSRLQRNLSRTEMRAKWFKNIKRQFKEIFRDVCRIWLKLITRCNHIYPIYTNSSAECLLINKHKRVKILPRLDNSIRAPPDANAINQLKNLMIQVITLPFDDPSDYMRNRVDYALGPVVRSFLDNLDVENLNYVGIKFLLSSHQFCFFENDKSKFIINLDEKIKRGDIDETDLSYCIGLIGTLDDWKDKVKFSNDNELSTIFQNGESSYKRLSSVVRFCSNVYRHCNDYSNQAFERFDIEDKLTAVLPDLYVCLFEALIEYGDRSSW
ncbi:hypothetical protein GQ457_16G029700 [Hibiscus cannabinus]